MKTLVVVSHPNFAQSRVIKALQNLAANSNKVIVRNLEAIYGNNLQSFDIDAEQAAYAGVDRVIYLFPIHWFNLTPMLKAYFNHVWSYGWAFGPNGNALQGKTMQVAVSAGASAYTYSAAGMIHCSIDEVLTPLKASALYVGMTYLSPFAIFEAMTINGEQLDAELTRFQQLLIGT